MFSLGDTTDDHPNPKRASLPKGMQLEDVTLETAVGLLSLPRLLGTHPETGAPIKAGQGTVLVPISFTIRAKKEKTTAPSRATTMS